MDILVVDDNSVNRRLLRKALEAKHYEVTEAQDGPTAINRVKDGGVDLILMDIMMPGMDGKTCASIIKKLTSDNHIPIIFVTALQAEESLSSALASGGDDFISKPVNLDHLESKIQAHARIKELHTQLKQSNEKLRETNLHLEREQELISYFFDNALSHNFSDPACVRQYISPLSAFNGDLLLVTKRPGGGLYALLGDFTGHGLSAAMGTVPVAQSFNRTTELGIPISEVVRELNKHLYNYLPIDMFMAATAIEIEPIEQTLTIWSGAMPAGYIVNQEERRLEKLVSRHMPLGVVPDREFDMKVHIYHYSKDDQLILLTDGIIEATNVDGDLYGENRLEESLQSFQEEVFDKILSELKQYQKGTGQDDDITLFQVSCSNVPSMEDALKLRKEYEFHIPVNYRIHLGPHEMKQEDPVTRIIDLVAKIPNVHPHRDVLHTVVSELYSNSLEHGLLRLDSVDKSTEDGFLQYYSERSRALDKLDKGFITVEIQYQPQPYKGDVLTIKLMDSGPGFRLSGSKRVENDLSGRGISLISSLCESYEYNETGNQVEVVFRCESVCEELKQKSA